MCAKIAILFYQQLITWRAIKYLKVRNNIGAKYERTKMSVIIYHVVLNKQDDTAPCELPVKSYSSLGFCLFVL